MEEKAGIISIAPDVLLDIVRLTSLSTPGVARLSALHPSGFKRLFNGKMAEGIQVQLQDGTVTIDLFVVAEPNIQMLQLGQTLQREISRAIQDVLGMPVKEINIHIEDVEDHLPSPASDD